MSFLFSRNGNPMVNCVSCNYTSIFYRQKDWLNFFSFEETSWHDDFLNQFCSTGLLYSFFLPVIGWMSWMICCLPWKMMKVVLSSLQVQSRSHTKWNKVYSLNNKRQQFLSRDSLAWIWKNNSWNWLEFRHEIH